MKVLAISTVLELFLVIGVAMVAVWVGFSLLGQIGFGTWGGGQISPGAGMFLLLLAPEFYQPMRDLAAAWHDRADAAAVADAVAPWEAAGLITIPGEGARVAPLAGPAEILLIGYQTQQSVPQPDIHIAAGETTLLRLIARLVPVATGALRVAGQSLSDDTADAARARIGWMPQAVHFLGESLRSSLLQEGAGDPWPALRLAAADQVVVGLPRGLPQGQARPGPGFPLAARRGGSRWRARADRYAGCDPR